MKKTRNILFTLSLYFLASSGVFAQNSYLKKEKTAPISKSEFNEFAPIPFRMDGKDGYVFCSDIVHGRIVKLEDSNGDNMSNIYFSELKDGEWGDVEDFAPELRIKGHNGPISFNLNGDMAVFVRNFADDVGTGLFFAEYDGSMWTNIVEFEHNKRGFRTIHPTLSSTGDTLYFASNDSTTGTHFGGYDIYVSYRKNGSWSKSENLGPVVNTSENEYFPYIHPSGRLYFSSNGHKGLGGYDIFYSDFFNKKWFKPISAPKINSTKDELTYYTDKNYYKVLWTSNKRRNSKKPGKLSIFESESRIDPIGFAPDQVENNYCYIFYEESTVSLDTTLYAYEWKMGDGNKVRALEAEHCYAGPGDYLIELNIIDKLTGVVEFNQAEYLVEVKKVIQPYIIVLDSSTFVNEKIHFDGRESFLGDKVAGEYIWEFGDGGKAVGPTVSHTYKSSKEFNVILQVTEKGNKSNDLEVFTVGIVINVTEKKQP